MLMGWFTKPIRSWLSPAKRAKAQKCFFWKTQHLFLSSSVHTFSLLPSTRTLMLFWSLTFHIFLHFHCPETFTALLHPAWHGCGLLLWELSIVIYSPTLFGASCEKYCTFQESRETGHSLMYMDPWWAKNPGFSLNSGPDWNGDPVPGRASW